MTDLMAERRAKTEYIRTTREMEFEDLKGRYTRLLKGVPGFILNEENIDWLHDLSKSQKERCLEMLEYALQYDRTLALVQGYRCLLRDEDFTRCDKPVCYPVTGEII